MVRCLEGWPLVAAMAADSEEGEYVACIHAVKHLATYEYLVD